MFKNNALLIFILITSTVEAQVAFDPEIRCSSNSDILFSFDGSHLFVHDPLGVDGKGLVKIYKTEDGINYDPIQSLNKEFQSGFGKSISVTDDLSRILIGAYKMNETGKAFLYEKVEQEYTLLRQFNPPIPTERYGWSVAISGDGNTAVIGSPHYNFKEEKGAVFIYDLLADSSASPIILKPENGEHDFGQQVKTNLDGSIVAIGTSTSDWRINCEGSISVFKKAEDNYLPLGNRITLSKDTCIHFATEMALSHDGLTLASGLSSNDFSAMVWRYEEDQWKAIGTGLFPFSGGRDHSSKINIDPTGNMIALSKALRKQTGEAIVFRLEEGDWKLMGEKILGDTDHFKSSAYNFTYDVMLVKELTGKRLLGFRWEE